jgi:hypothetical protein
MIVAAPSVGRVNLLFGHRGRSTIGGGQSSLSHNSVRRRWIVSANTQDGS